MKRTKLIVLGMLLALGLVSCENGNWDFPDYEYNAVYFPYQYPVRTLVMGDYMFDNENDTSLRFLVSTHIGGMYENKNDWTVDFVVDESLANKVKTSTGDTIKALPAAYYTLSPSGQMTISKGKFYGSVTVQLTDAFIADTNAWRVHYVLPLRITASSADSVLSGLTESDTADYRIAGEWAIVPKNFTLFGVKYVNAYHGKYLHRGRTIRDIAGVKDTVVYRQRFIELDEIWSLKTRSIDDVILTGTLRTKSGSPGVFNLKLTFDNNDNCVVTSEAGSVVPVTGTGKMVKEGDEWGGIKRSTIYLDCTASQAGTNYTIQDTLVFRDKDVRFESFVPVVF